MLRELRPKEVQGLGQGRYLSCLGKCTLESLGKPLRTGNTGTSSLQKPNVEAFFYFP